MNKWPKKIEDTRRRMNELNERRIRMVQQREKPIVIHAVSDAYLREYERLKVYEYCSTH